jgi:hypothetical protein
MNRRFLALSADFASLVRGTADRIRKPPFYPLNYGNKFQGSNDDFSVSGGSSKSPLFYQIGGFISLEGFGMVTDVRFADLQFDWGSNRIVRKRRA